MACLFAWYIRGRRRRGKGRISMERSRIVVTIAVWGFKYVARGGEWMNG